MITLQLQNVGVDYILVTIGQIRSATISSETLFMSVPDR